VIVFF